MTPTETTESQIFKPVAEENRLSVRNWTDDLLSLSANAGAYKTIAK